MEHLQIKMLGDFSFRIGDMKISCSDNRSKKVWMLLAYVLYRRGCSVSRKELIELLWGDEAGNNPENALKTTFYRVRSLLNQLGEQAGHQLILWQDGGYTWNMQIPMTIDTDEFEALCRREVSDIDQLLQTRLQAVSLYKGSFLNGMFSEPWIIPAAAYFHNLYIQTVLECVPLLHSASRYTEAASVCQAALKAEPYDERLHQYLMTALIALGDCKGAIAVYEELNHQLFADLGIKPGKKIQELYREATRTLNQKTLPLDSVVKYIQEDDALSGAMQCDYDQFKILCHAEARTMTRSGKAAHIALLSVHEAANRELSRHSLDNAMKHLGEHIRTNLRRGDIFAQCSNSQYVIMLPQANYENSCMVCQRVLISFARRHPHSPARIHYAVHPLTNP